MFDVSQLQRAVLTALDQRSNIVAAHVGVITKNGVVTLFGHVESSVQKHAATEAARRVKGVMAVADELDVRLVFDLQNANDDIAADTEERLAWEAALSAGAVEVSWAEGWVTLGWEKERHDHQGPARRNVHGLGSVPCVPDQITIWPEKYGSTIADDIMHALHCARPFDPPKVVVASASEHFRLTGAISSWNERRVAAEAASAVLGTVRVATELMVE